MIDKTLAQKYRTLARNHFNGAKSLLDKSDDHLPFVCLRLRQCIEALSYGLLILYRHELSAAAMRSWTPRRVLDELQSVDPDANKSRTLEIGLPGADGSPAVTIISGEDRRFSPKWANVAYNKLSSFLHVPTPKTLEENSVVSIEKIRSQCAEYASYLGSVFETDIWHFISGRFVEIGCECGFNMKRRLESISVGSVFECGECSRIYDVLSMDEEKVGVLLRKARLTCKACDTENALGAHELEEGKEISCQQCGKVIKLKKVWAMSQD
jgi:hypothetical protein